MKINIFSLLFIILVSNIEARFAHDGSRHIGGRRNINKSFNKNSPGISKRKTSGNNNNYSHGGFKNNNFNAHNNVYGNFGSFGNSAAWGLGGLGMGLMIGGAMASSNTNNKNITIINSYDNQKEHNIQKTNSNYDNIIQTLKSEIETINELSQTINEAEQEIDNNYIPPIIKSYFAPHKKINIIKTTSNELYGDFNQEKVEIVNFTGNQKISKKIEKIRNQIQFNLNKLMLLTDIENNNIFNQIKNDLITALKRLNHILLHTAKKLQEE